MNWDEINGVRSPLEELEEAFRRADADIAAYEAAERRSERRWRIAQLTLLAIWGTWAGVTALEILT